MLLDGEEIELAEPFARGKVEVRGDRTDDGQLQAALALELEVERDVLAREARARSLSRFPV